jgi:hypothetical protein
MLQHAAKLGLTTVAITDHDNARGAREARPLAQALGLNLIPGIEFTCRWTVEAGAPKDQDVDLLGYFVDLDDAGWQRVEAAALDDFEARVGECCARLTAAGTPVTLDDVRVENPRYAGAMQLIFTLRRQGYVEGWDSAMALFLKHWEPVRLSALSIARAIAAIHAAGGVAVLAHPTLVECDAGWLQAPQIATLVEMGLDGLEVYHYRLDDAARAHFVGLAAQFDLAVSGGSDEHGWRAGFTRMGTQPVTEAMVQTLRDRRGGKAAPSNCAGRCAHCG